MPDLSKTILKAWAVLEHLAQADGGGLTLGDLTLRVQDSKTSTLRVLNTLVATGLVELGASNRYELGPAVVTLANARLRNKPLFAEGMPILRGLVSATGCTGYLGYLRGTDAIVLHMEIGVDPVAILAQPGQLYKAHTVAFGKALLAVIPDTHITQLYAEYDFTPGAARISSLQSLFQEIHQIRQLGYAFATETFPGMRSYGLAVPTSMGYAGLSLSLSVVGKSEQVIAEREEAISQHLRLTAQSAQIKGGGLHGGYV